MVLPKASFWFYCLKIAPFNIFINKSKMEDIECVFESMSGKGSLFISNYQAAQNLQLLQSKGIKAILSVARSGLVNHKKVDIPHYLYIPAEDREDYPIYQYFDQTYDFIEKARKQCNVLVHCMVGVSRSVTILIAYLLKKYKYTLSQVITMIQRKRRKLNPNKGFIEQLKKFSQEQGIKCDFQGTEVNRRESSTSKQIRTYSVQKQRTFTHKKNEPLTPILYSEKQNKKEKINENNIFHSQDLPNPIVKIQQNQHKKTKINEQKSMNNEQDEIGKKIGSNVKLQMKKSFSMEADSQRKRSSIEQKISKIRQRLIKSDQVSKKEVNTSIMSIYLAQRESKNNIQKHFSPSNIDKLKQKQLKILNKASMAQASNQDCLKPLQSNKIGPQQSVHQFTAQIKIERTTLYHNNQRKNGRINPRLRQEINY